MYLTDDTTIYPLPKGRITARQGSTKVVIHEYEFTDHNDATFMGRGPTRLTVGGTCTTEELDLLDFITSSGQLLTLFYASAEGGVEDRYYRRVLALPVRPRPMTLSMHRYEIELHALDGVPYGLNDQPVY